MKQQNISRQDLAERMGCSPQYISRLLKGEENFSLETICKLENALNVPIFAVRVRIAKICILSGKVF